MLQPILYALLPRLLRLLARPLARRRRPRPLPRPLPRRQDLGRLHKLAARQRDLLGDLAHAQVVNGRDESVAEAEVGVNLVQRVGGEAAGREWEFEEVHYRRSEGSVHDGGLVQFSWSGGGGLAGLRL